MEDQNISEFIKEIGKEIERTSGAKLNFPQKSTIVKEEWITESEMMAMQKKKRVQLRTAEQTRSMKAVELKRFNPSYLYAACPSIPCRMSGCPETTKNLIYSRDKNQNKIKQDLFLCETHRKTLKDRVLERCAQEHVILNDASFKNDHFNGYTRLIGELEKAFVYLNSKWFNSSHSLLAEVFLNSRNFLIITNALLNPDEDNRGTVLAAYLRMLQNCLQQFWENPDLMVRRVTALQEIMNILPAAFGVVCKWVLLINPGTGLGGGIGFVLGWVGSKACGLSPEETIQNALVGFASGLLIGGSAVALHRQNMQIKENQQIRKEILSEYLHFVAVNAHGDVALEKPGRSMPV